MSGTRGHSLRILGRPFGTEMRRNLFTQRVVNLCNSPPHKAVEIKSTNIFNKEIDRFLNSKVVKVYGESAGVWH